MELRPIKTELDYQNALKEIEQLLDVEPNSVECVAKPCLQAYQLDILATLIEAYEQKHYPIEAPDAISAIFYYLEARGLSEHDLVDYIGTREQVAAILNKQQPLTLDNIRRLNQNLGIPAEILIKPYSLMKTSV